MPSTLPWWAVVGVNSPASRGARPGGRRDPLRTSDRMRSSRFSSRIEPVYCCSTRSPERPLRGAFSGRGDDWAAGHSRDRISIEAVSDLAAGPGDDNDGLRTHGDLLSRPESAHRAPPVSPGAPPRQEDQGFFDFPRAGHRLAASAAPETPDPCPRHPHAKLGALLSPRSWTRSCAPSPTSAPDVLTMTASPSPASPSAFFALAGDPAGQPRPPSRGAGSSPRGAIFDMLDGRVARLRGGETKFGAYLGLHDGPLLGHAPVTWGCSSLRPAWSAPASWWRCGWPRSGAS